MMYLVQESQLLTEPGFHGMPLWNDFPLSDCKIATEICCAPTPKFGSVFTHLRQGGNSGLNAISCLIKYH